MIKPDNSVSANPWEEELDERSWSEIAEGLQRKADALPRELDALQPAARSHDLRLGIRLEDYSPRLLSGYGTVNASANGDATPDAAKKKTAAQSPGNTPGWWNRSRLDLIQNHLRERIFSEVLPGEEFIIGQEGRGVRIFNFGEPLNEERQRDCGLFVDLVTQYMGDHAYDLMTDVVIADFAGSSESAEIGDHGFAGLADPGNGLLLVNAAILHDEAPTDTTAEGSLFLQTLTHEFGHLLHGDIRHDAQARKELEEFAETIGWDVKGMREDSHDWLAKDAENRPYAPLYATSNTIFMPPNGSPTEYGTKNPMESLGETNKHIMLGSTVMSEMTETEDAWLVYLQKRMLQPGETLADRPIATPLDRKPITINRYIGADIRYP